MTNFDYIKTNLKELDLAVYMFLYDIIIKDQPLLFSEKIYDVWRNSGRNHTVSFLVWLSKQYDPEDWKDGGNES